MGATGALGRLDRAPWQYAPPRPVRRALRAALAGGGRARDAGAARFAGGCAGLDQGFRHHAVPRAGAHLLEAIESVRAQTEQDWELPPGR